MKKIYFVIAALAAVALSSCEKEKDFKDATPLGEDDIAFSLQSAATRSMETVAPQAGMTIKLNDEVCLEETIEEMDYASPATRGVPAYTFNVGNIYKTLGVYGEGDFGEANYEKMDEEMVAGGWRYRHNYDGDPWPDETSDVNFYLWMPATQTGVSNMDFADQQITFEFNSPINGKDQQDILFSHTAFSKEENKTFHPNGAPVTMYHALTGVKFRNGHSNDGSTKTVIKSVKFKGLKSYGVCTVTPGAEEGTTSKYKVEWSGLDLMSNFTMTFNNPTYVAEDGEDNPDGTISYGSGEGQVNTFNGTSWNAAATDHNLNDEDGSMTFWFIPQTIDESVTLEITFLVKTPDTPNGTEVPHIIKFGELVTKTTGEGESAEKTYTEWKAGQLRTYTLKPFDVDVEIFDKMTNLKKENLHVTNTGNVDEYVRIMIIGNWYGWKSADDRAANPNNPTILVGYTSADPNNDTMVTPWYREDDLYKTGFDSTFPGGRPLASSHWKRGTGSYFYYDTKIGAGQQLSGTDALFQYYQLETSMIPTIYLPVANQTARAEAVGVHLVMEVVVQAIPTTVNGTEVDCWTAWSNAVGKEIKAK